MYVLTLFLGFLGNPAHATEPLPVDGEGVPFHDELLDRLVGTWKVEGEILGSPATQTLTADWTLAHQFLALHILETTPGTRSPYEAHVFLGYDNMSERYVAHWIDVFGGRTSETLGYGTRTGDTLELVFEYPHGPFRTQFIWNAKTATWRLTGRTKTSQGVWMDFMRYDLHH